MHVQFSHHALKRYSAQAEDDSCKYPGIQKYESKSHGIVMKDECLRCLPHQSTPTDTCLTFVRQGELKVGSSKKSFSQESHKTL